MEVERLERVQLRESLGKYVHSLQAFLRKREPNERKLPSIVGMFAQSSNDCGRTISIQSAVNANAVRGEENMSYTTAVEGG